MGCRVNKYNLLVALCSVGFIYMLTKQQSAPLNVRYNNPLNIRTGNDWDGERERDIEKGYEEFITPAFGFRAAYKLLMNYKNWYGADTLQTIINRWAPAKGSHDGQTYVNHTQSYIKYVSERIGINPSDEIPAHIYPELMLAMADFEGAKGAFNLSQAREGVALA
jgi:hypothetical protein